MNSKNIIWGLTIVGCMFSCTAKFDDYNTNHNVTNKVTPAMLATDMLLNITQLGGAKYSLFDNMLNKQIAWSEGSQQDEQYNRLGRVSFSTYTNITNCQKMLLEAETSSEPVQNSYKGLAKFVKAYNLFHLSMQVGDIPYSDSNKGEEGNITPKYDTQKDVMLQILNDLEEARSLFSHGDYFDGDPILNGDPQLWKKTVTSFELKVLINLSKKENDQDLNIKQRFAEIAVSSDLLTSNDDNL